MPGCLYHCTTIAVPLPCNHCTSLLLPCLVPERNGRWCFMAAFKSFQQKDARDGVLHQSSTNPPKRCQHRWKYLTHHNVDQQQCDIQSDKIYECLQIWHGAVIAGFSTESSAVKMAPPIIWTFEDSTRATLQHGWPGTQDCKDKLYPDFAPKILHFALKIPIFTTLRLSSSDIKTTNRKDNQQ